MLSTPLRKLHRQDQMIDFAFNHVLGTSIPPPGTSFESSNLHALQQHHPVHDSITAGSPPMAVSSPLNPTPSYTFSQGNYEEYPPWPPQMTESHPLCCNYYSIPGLSAMHFHIYSSQDNAHSSVLRNNVKHIDSPQRRGTPLQRFHGRGEVKKDISEEIPVSTIPKAMHMCDFPGCGKQTAFKRREHLRRHQNTKHGLGDTVMCKFCTKKFNQRDNWRQHLRLHTEPNRPMARTNYYEEAVQQYEEERSNTKRRIPPVKKE
ncbi:C2H2 type zinc finger domain protein [Apiospora saccharicola]